MIRGRTELLGQLRTIHAAIRAQVVAACETSALEHVAQAVAEQAGDTIYAIDRVSEAVLIEHFARLAELYPLVLIAEGLHDDGEVVLPAGQSREAAEMIVIVDPIDGTRGLMYQKRSAWILTGVAANCGPTTNLADIELALMTEIPLVKQHLSDSFWAVAGQGVVGERYNRLTGATTRFVPQPSRALSIAQGFGNIARFFPGARDLLAAIDDEIVATVLGPAPAGRALTFEDQYISSGGQLAELMLGHDRWIADLRPLIEPLLAARGQPSGLHCHPYDLCTELIAREAGVVVLDPATGKRLQSLLDVHSSVAWAGFANQAICDQVLPALQQALHRRGVGVGNYEL